MCYFKSNHSFDLHSLAFSALLLYFFPTFLINGLFEYIPPQIKILKFHTAVATLVSLLFVRSVNEMSLILSIVDWYCLKWPTILLLCAKDCSKFFV